MKTTLLFLTVFTALSLALPIPISDDSEDTVTTNYGPVRGIVEGKTRAFLGIRYGVISARWTPPAAPAPWTSVYDATNYPPGCPQRCVLPPDTCPLTQSEDCLFLNVFTPRPSLTNSTSLPVMAYLHGGRYEQGVSGGKIYNSSLLAEEDVVVVTLNYRLNFLGWLASDELDGNHGLKDQQLALRWIQENIAFFGGNPNQVTLFGQSAGAGSIAAHMSSPNSENLFHRAIIQSNPWSIRFRARTDAVCYGKQFAKKAGCHETKNLDCLRNKTLDELFDAEKAVIPIPEPHPLNMVLRWTPTVDGKNVPEQPMQMAQKGTLKQVPVMMGSVGEDGRLFIFELSEKPINYKEYVAAEAGVFGTKAAPLMALYPDTNHTDAHEVLSVETTDGIFECANRFVFTQLAKTFAETSAARRHHHHYKQGEYPLYFYRFDHPLSWDAWGPRYAYCVGHTCHGAELPLVFGTGAEYFTEEEKALSLAMRKYWTSFAKSADASPNYDGGVEWKPFLGASGEFNSILLKNQIESMTNVKKDVCDVWDSVHWYQKQ